MRPHQRARIKRLKAIEQTVPQNRDQTRSDKKLRKFHEGIALELATLDGAAQDGAECLDHSREHLAIVELRELRKARAFADDEADHVLAARAIDFANEH